MYSRVFFQVNLGCVNCISVSVFALFFYRDLFLVFLKFFLRNFYLGLTRNCVTRFKHLKITPFIFVFANLHYEAILKGLVLRLYLHFAKIRVSILFTKNQFLKYFSNLRLFYMLHKNASSF